MHLHNEKWGFLKERKMEKEKMGKGTKSVRAGLGALLSYAFVPCMPLFDRQDFRQIAKMINEVGTGNAIFFTDFV